jgi:cobyric acid synthase
MSGGGLLVAGTHSDAGKSVLTAGICRWHAARRAGRAVQGAEHVQ